MTKLISNMAFDWKISISNAVNRNIKRFAEQTLAELKFSKGWHIINADKIIRANNSLNPKYQLHQWDEQV